MPLGTDLIPLSYPKIFSPPSYISPSSFNEVAEFKLVEAENSKILSKGTAFVFISTMPPPNSPGMSAE